MFYAYFFRPRSMSLITPGQLLAQYRLAKPDERALYMDKEPTLSADRYILVSGPNVNVPLEDRCLPTHIVLSDGRILLLLRNCPARVIDTEKHKDKHSQMYADMFLYVPWEDEEHFLGGARRSLEACQAKWEEWGEAALDLKNQLRSMVKESWLA